MKQPLQSPTKSAEKRENAPPAFVVFDTNIWISQRLLQSSLGSAVLYAFTGSGTLIGVPEVIELEVFRVLEDDCEDAFKALRKASQLLTQVSGMKSVSTAPSSKAIRDGIALRWKQLEGRLIKIPFTHEHARAALERIISHLPPSGKNNEQFRDCCIWEATLELAAKGTVYLVTNDGAFYRNRDPANGLAENLIRDLEKFNRNIQAFPNLESVLSSLGSSIEIPKETAIKDKIIEAVGPTANSILSERRGEFVIEGVKEVEINGYTTPTKDVVAVSFEVLYAVQSLEEEGDVKKTRPQTLRVSGTCSYDPKTTQMSEIVVTSWTARLGESGLSSTLDPSLVSRYGKGSLRLVE